MSMLNEVNRRPITDTKDRSFLGRIRDIVPWKGDSPKEIIRKTVFIVSVGVLIYWCYTAYIYFMGSKTMINDHKELSELYNNSTSDQSAADNLGDNSPLQTTDVNSQGNTVSDQPAIQPQRLSRFDELYAINPDIVGWLRIDGIYLEDTDELAIDYPIVQTTDNDYYLEKDFFGEKQDYGALFADYRANLTGIGRSSNVTIYGHNMKTEYYFHHLRDYNRVSPSFVSDHRLIDFSTLYSEDQYIIIGCFYVSVNEEDDNQPLFAYHNCVEFNNDAEFDYWYKNVMYRNYYLTDIDCNINDEYLTLSTCAFEISDSRFVVVSRKLRPGEDPSVYTYESNPDRHMPEKWYKANGKKVPVDDGPDYEYYVPE